MVLARQNDASTTEYPRLMKSLKSSVSQHVLHRQVKGQRLLLTWAALGLPAAQLANIAGAAIDVTAGF